jgi:hypothetical protein
VWEGSQALWVKCREVKNVKRYDMEFVIGMATTLGCTAYDKNFDIIFFLEWVQHLLNSKQEGDPLNRGFRYVYVDPCHVADQGSRLPIPTLSKHIYFNHKQMKGTVCKINSPILRLGRNRPRSSIHESGCPRMGVSLLCWQALRAVLPCITPPICILHAIQLTQCFVLCSRNDGSKRKSCWLHILNTSTHVNRFQAMQNKGRPHP